MYKVPVKLQLQPDFEGKDKLKYLFFSFWLFEHYHTARKLSVLLKPQNEDTITGKETEKQIKNEERKEDNKLLKYLSRNFKNK